MEKAYYRAKRQAEQITNGDHKDGENIDDGIFEESTENIAEDITEGIKSAGRSAIRSRKKDKRKNSRPSRKSKNKDSHSSRNDGVKATDSYAFLLTDKVERSFRWLRERYQHASV